jgi:hypothetical protein
MAAGPRRTGLKEYLKHAFLARWNLLFFLGGMGAAVLSPWPDAIAPLVMGLEIAYLTGLTAMPRFRTAIDAKLAAEARGKPAQVAPNVQQSLERTIEKLPPAALRRFLAIRQRCFEMREIATGVRGHDGGSGALAADDVRTPALDRLLFLFLKLLSTQAGLERFLKSTSERELELRVEDLRQRLTAAQTGQDERVVRSLQDSLADAELRLDNYRKSKKDSEFVAIELDRIETKIQALVEMAVSRQDPDTLSHQVTAAAESMQQTEEAVNQLQHLTGLADQLEDTPPILGANIGQIFAKER